MARRHGGDPAYFWSRIARAGPDECWIWQGCVEGSGYGRIYVDGRNWTSHRRAFHLSKGAIPPGAVIMHRCDNTRCCNPAHLIASTQAENMEDMVRKRRSRNHRKSACIHGHPFDEENTRYFRGKNGRTHRRCRQCEADASARYQRNRRFA